MSGQGRMSYQKRRREEMRRLGIPEPPKFLPGKAPQKDSSQGKRKVHPRSDAENHIPSNDDSDDGNATQEEISDSEKPSKKPKPDMHCNNKSGGSLMSSIFGSKKGEEGKIKPVNSNAMDLFSSQTASYRQVSKQRQEKIRAKHQEVASKNQRSLLSPKMILQRRRERVNNTEKLVASVTVDMAEYCQNLSKEADSSEEEGVARLLAGRCSPLFRENGVLILKSLLLESTKKKKKKKKSKKSNLMQEMQAKAKEVERQICERLNEKLGEDSYRPPPKTPEKALLETQKKDASFRFVEVASRCLGRLDIRHGMNQAPFANLHVPCELRDTHHENQQYNNTVVKLLWPVVQDLLGKDAELVYMGLICSFPGSEDQPWHQDGTALFPDAPSELTDNLPPYALNVFIPLLDVTEALGPTEFWLGSHATNDAQDFLSKQDDLCGDPNDCESDEKPPIIGPLLSVGDALIYDYRICHRGTSNLNKKNTTRPMLYLMYARPWFKEHLNFGTEHLFDTK